MYNEVNVGLKLNIEVPPTWLIADTPRFLTSLSSLVAMRKEDEERQPQNPEASLDDAQETHAGEQADISSYFDASKVLSM